MDERTKRMILEFLGNRGGDVERTARFMAYTLRIGPIAVCRAFISQAQRS